MSALCITVIMGCANQAVAGCAHENIVKLQEKKMALADQIIGGEEMGSGSFSKEELLKEL